MAAAVKQLLSCIRTRECAWQTVVRCFKQLYPDSVEREADIKRFVERMYDVSEKKFSELWALPTCGNTVLEEFVKNGTSRQLLITETIPKVFGGLPVRSFTVTEDKDGLDFVLDSVPTQKKYLNLENGCFGGVKVCLSAPPLQPTASPFAAP